MVTTRTKRLLEASADESNESSGENEADGSYNSQELTAINMSNDTEEMVYLHNPSKYTPPKEFINLVGGPQTFEKLMKCVESDGRSIHRRVSSGIQIRSTERSINKRA